jgi:hypothetical protein
MKAASFRALAISCLVSLPPAVATADGPSAGLAGHLQAVLAAQAAGNPEAATRKLAAFKHHVMAFVRAGLITGDEGREWIQAPANQGCWKTSPVTYLERNSCVHVSASAENGGEARELTVAGYFSDEHPFTCYLSAYDDDDAYDGGCNLGREINGGGQFTVSWSCEDKHGVYWYSSGWLDGGIYDGFCDRGFIVACDIQVRVPSDDC